MTKFSANLGLLFTEYDLPDAIRAAAKAGFDAVECHWPYATPPEAVRQALAETGLNILGINTARGDANKGEFGLTALPGRKTEARHAIDQAIDYAIAISCHRIHVMAGNSRDPTSQDTFIQNLKYAAQQVASQAPHLTLMIEPINHIDLPDYALTSIDQALAILEAVESDHLKLMFDCYHIGKMGGDVPALIKAHIADIAHIQFASIPDRGTPDHGDLDYASIFDLIADLGYTAPLGAEYKPQGKTEDSLNWLKNYR